jgi:hypothetical protein
VPTGGRRPQDVCLDIIGQLAQADSAG